MERWYYHNDVENPRTSYRLLFILVFYRHFSYAICLNKEDAHYPIFPFKHG